MEEKHPLEQPLRIRSSRSHDDCVIGIVDCLGPFELCFRCKLDQQSHMDRDVNSLAGVFPPKVREPLRALSGAAHVRPSKTWKRRAVRMVDLLLGGMQLNVRGHDSRRTC
jgi:hypothetical protein